MFSPSGLMKRVGVGGGLVPFFKCVCVYFLAAGGTPSAGAAAAKCAPVLCLLAAVLLLLPASPSERDTETMERRRYGRRVALGLALSALGDALLVWEQHFAAGMAAFALAHVAYMCAFRPLAPRRPAGLYNGCRRRYGRRVALGLALSALGDALLVWEQHFAAGMAAFALAHVAYMCAFRPLAPRRPAGLYNGCRRRYGRRVALGLALSALGDALLVWEQHFAAGMAAFALAHVAYMCAFRPLAPRRPAGLYNGCRRRYGRRVALGLALSALGDALLVWEQHFAAGMAAFALAHVAYMCAFRPLAPRRPAGLYNGCRRRYGRRVALGLALSALGDALLVWEQHFAAGMAAFALAHVAYMCAFRPLAPRRPAGLYNGCRRRYGRRVALGLALSALGDALLVWEQHFAAGMAAFALAHVAYMCAFRPLAPRRHAGLLLYLGAAAYCTTISPPPALSIAVPLYSILLVSMAWRALRTLPPQPCLRSVAAPTGALLFVVSDAFLGYSLFGGPLPYRRVLVMSTYYLGQLGLALSALLPPQPVAC